MSYDQPKRILDPALPAPGIQGIQAIPRIPGIPMIPIPSLSILDPLLGQVAIDQVEAPRALIKADLALPLSPMRALQRQAFTIVPTSEARKMLIDVPTNLSGRGVRIAVLDTGNAPLHPQIATIPGFSTCATDPTPADLMGHGSWVTSACAGRKTKGIFGVCEGIAPGAEVIHIKVLHGLTGFGTSMDIIRGMDLAEKLDADIVSLSLGSDACQGGCVNCPECRQVGRLAQKGVLVVVASGNSGPKKWTISCPGCSPGAITVAAWSITDEDVSAFSSRGPQNIENRDMGIDPRTRKPDVAAPGGGRAREPDGQDEVLYSGEVGWMESMYTGIRHGFGAMKGTSQATPMISGLLALWQEYAKTRRGTPLTPDEVRDILATYGAEKGDDAGFGVPKLSWVMRYLEAR